MEAGILLILLVYMLNLYIKSFFESHHLSQRRCLFLPLDLVVLSNSAPVFNFLDLPFHPLFRDSTLLLATLYLLCVTRWLLLAAICFLLFTPCLHAASYFLFASCFLLFATFYLLLAI